jgi:hypothetical protein
MRLAATCDATDRSSIPFCLRFFPQDIYFSYFLTDDRGLPKLNIPEHKKKSPLSAPQAPISYTSNVDIYTGLSRAFFMPEKRVHADSVA